MAQANSEKNEQTKSKLGLIDVSIHRFTKPIKKIEDGEDVTFFIHSKAYDDIVSFIFQLNISLFPQKVETEQGHKVQKWVLGSEALFSSFPTVIGLRAILQKLKDYMLEVLPDTGPRRFGNISFRKWFDILRHKSLQFLEEYLPNIFTSSVETDGSITAADELVSYFMGSFGSAERLDYGTGHELNFIAFLAGIWKLGGFRELPHGEAERAIVIGVFEPYIQLIRELIIRYTLEPAGSHGVWGLDDHFFLPYLFGSAQLSSALSATGKVPTEGSLSGSPAPTDVTKSTVIQQESKKNMYFSAISFINEVKKGPFWEHSPILYDISGVKAGWAKINKGMMKMYLAEVLSKFPVVQHFLFGSIFLWEPNLTHNTVAETVHLSSQPRKDKSISLSATGSIQQHNTHLSAAKLGQNKNAIDENSPQAAKVIRPVYSPSSNIALTKAPWANTEVQAALPDQPKSIAYTTSTHKLRNPGSKG